MSDEPCPLTLEQAEAYLPDGDTIHTMRNTVPGLFVGADWERQEIVDHIGFHGAELSGPAATKAGYGIVVRDVIGPLFIATRKEPTVGGDAE